MDLDSYGATTKISQKIATQPGENYKLSFALKGNSASGQENTVNVHWGTTLVEAFASVDNNTTWEVKTYNLQAQSSETILSFDNLGEIADGSGTRLDGVCVNLSR